MQQVTQTTAAEAEQSAATAEELNAQAETTLGTVRELDAFVLGGAPSTTRVVKMDSKKKAAPGRVLSGPGSAESAPLKKTGTYGGF